MQVSRDGLTLHLSEHYGDACPGSTVFVRLDGPEEHLNPGIERDEDIGLNTMETIEPFGNRIRFSEDLKLAADSHAGQ